MKANGPVNEYGFPLGGCLFGTVRFGKSAYSNRCACANCGVYRNWRAGQFRAKRKAQAAKRAAKRAAAQETH